LSARPISSGVASFGLVSIPFKVYVAAHAEEAQFNLLHDKCKGRLRQQYVCPGCGGEIVDREHMCKGFEYAKDVYVSFTEAEMKKLEAAKTSSLEIVEFVPDGSIEPEHIEKSYFLGPDRGAERAYQLLAYAMAQTSSVAIGKFWTHGKLQLVAIRPHYSTYGLVMHYVWYVNETRSFESIGLSPVKKGDFKDVEIDLAKRLIVQLGSDKFRPEKYRDEYRDRVRAAVDQKIAGQELRVAEEEASPTIIDLFEALKRSVRS
jgi:DNA end-binding protein Ku